MDPIMIKQAYQSIWEENDIFKDLGQSESLPGVDSDPFCCSITPDTR